MSRWMKGLLHLGLCALLSTAVKVPTASAQATGIRFIFPEFGNSMKGYPGFRNWRGGVGFERRTADGLGFGLDASIDLFSLSIDGEGYNLPSIQVGNDRFTYHEKVRDWALIYRSSYYFGREDGFYLGTFFGVRGIRQKLTQTSSSYYYSWGSPPSTVVLPTKVDVNGLVFPVGVRFGVSSEMDGWFQDLYFQMGTQLGAGPKAINVPELEAAASKKAGFMFLLGYAFGVGW